MSRQVAKAVTRAVLSRRGGWLAGAAAWLLLAAAGAVLWMVALRELWPALDVAAPLTVHALLAAPIAAVALMLARGRLLFLVSASGAVLLAPSLLTLDARETGEATGLMRLADPPGVGRLSGEERPILRVLAINTWRENGSLDDLVRYLVRADAAVVVLSEFGPEKRRLLDLLKRAYPYQAGCADIEPCAQVLLSRERFERAGTVMPSLTDPPLVWAEYRAGGQKITVFGTHIYRPTRHFGWHRDQLAGLAHRVRRTEGSVIVAGDFNASRLSRTFSDFLAASGLVGFERELASWPAWPSRMPLPQVQIDHLLVSSDLTIVDQRIGAPVGSDHLPLWSAVRLPDRATIMAGAPSAAAAPGEALR